MAAPAATGGLLVARRPPPPATASPTAPPTASPTAPPTAATRRRRGHSRRATWGTKWSPSRSNSWRTTRVFKRFREVNPELVPRSLSASQAHSVLLPAAQLESLPELRENPFKRRICQVFSHDGSGNLSFEDFLDMMSVFSEAAPRDIKAWYAFRIYDLDDDMYIGRGDLLAAARLLTRGRLSARELQDVVASVLDEADLDADQRLSFLDFEHVVVRAPDFLSTFHIRV